MSDAIVFDPTRHTWLCIRPHTSCPPSCACHCHRPAPSEPDDVHGWVKESEL